MLLVTTFCKEEALIFKEHKITAFSASVSALPDAPRLTPTELKARFDASPEELRLKHNAACDAAEALDTKVEGIVAQTYGGTIHESMLDAPLGAKLNAKAEKAALTAETNARAAADTALQKRMTAAESTKCEVVFGTYTGSGVSPQQIELGFQPAAVLVQAGQGWNPHETYMTPTGFALPDVPSYDLTVTATGFAVTRILSYTLAKPYRYMAFKLLA